MSYIRVSAYIEDLVTNGKHLKKVQQEAVKKLREFGTRKFDAIAFRGISGALVAPAVAATLGKRLIIVRKSIESSHADYLVEGIELEAFLGEATNKNRYVFIDDFIDSGDTLKDVKLAISEASNYKAKLVCVLLYQTDYIPSVTGLADDYEKISFVVQD